MPMRGRERTLFRLFGLPVKASPSWLFLVALVIFSLSQAYFPQELGPGVSWQLNLLLATVGAFGLFASLIAHEMAHSLVARATGMPVAGITLFIFGGVSQLEEEPKTAASEFFMAVVGPLCSVLLGWVFLTMWGVATLRHWPLALCALLKYLFIVNFFLAAFNSVPAFPLDGGRVLRSAVWAVSGSLRVATLVAARIGSAFGVLLIVLGVGVFLMGTGGWVAGTWFVILGFFLRQAALGSLQLMILNEEVSGQMVSDFMTSDPVTVPADTNLEQFVRDWAFHHRFSRFPVVDESGSLLGFIAARAPRGVHPRSWPFTSVRSLTHRWPDRLVFRPDTDGADALSTLRPQDDPYAIVVEDGRPVGVVTLGDLLRFLSLKADLARGRR